MSKRAVITYKVPIEYTLMYSIEEDDYKDCLNISNIEELKNYAYENLKSAADIIYHEQKDDLSYHIEKNIVVAKVEFIE